MKNMLQKSFVGLILILCLIPSLGLAFFGPAEPAANEIPPEKPALLTPEGKFNTGCLTELTDYVAGSFALRRQCISAWSFLNEKLFHTSVQSKVVVGKNGWLYYAETLDDYGGKGLSDELLDAAARNVSLLEEYVSTCGAEFIFTVAPNKNSLYPGSMPRHYVSDHDNSNAARIDKYFNKYGVNYADLFRAFNSREDVLYYATDTHWNAKGAALACDTLMNVYGKNSSFCAGPFIQTGIRQGDLYEMLIPEGKGSETGIAYGEKLEYECEGNPKEGNAITIKTRGRGSGRLKCWRDSFGIELYPYLSCCFENAEFSRLAAYDLLDIQNSFDFVLIELCERNISQLLTQTAVYPAPEREVPALVTGAERIGISQEERSGTGLKHVTAVLPANTDLSRSVYVLCGSGCCYEASVTLSEDGTGLSAFIPEQYSAEGIAVPVDGETVLFAAA